MELVRQELSIDVSLAAQDAANLMQRVMSSVTNIGNLNGSAFLDASGRRMTLPSELRSARPEGLSFFRFSFSLDPVNIDTRITQKPTFFSFCLRLPQHRYYIQEDKIEEMFSPVKRKSGNRPTRKMASLVGTPANLFNTPMGPGATVAVAAVGVEPGAGPIDAATTPATPKMDALFGGSSNVIIGYYGGLEFIDKQEEFDATFGSDPVILPSDPVSSDTASTSKLLLDFSNQC